MGSSKYLHISVSQLEWLDQLDMFEIYRSELGLDQELMPHMLVLVNHDTQVEVLVELKSQINIQGETVPFGTCILKNTAAWLYRPQATSWEHKPFKLKIKNR